MERVEPRPRRETRGDAGRSRVGRRTPGPPLPRREGDGKYRVRGRTGAGRWLQVIYVFSPPGVVYVIHARPLTGAEKQQERKRR